MTGDGQAPDGRRGLSRADAALAIVLMAIVGMMIVPLPTPLLDVLIAGNVALALVMVLIALVIPDGLAFTAMPTVLLVTTLYRLALNVSSTRLILLQADAGEVIRAFGDFVVRGDYVVGGVVFLILTLIQYVVVARGAERVAEVGARFTLDAMPGKQMAIDADLRAGSCTPDAARRRRSALERESQFYGAMDGAMKFVKGDAIAGIAITVLDLVAGAGIGVGTRGLSVTESLEVYGLLTVGDGLVSQIPSLLISTSAGLVVTRVASADGGRSLGSDVAAQLFADPRVLGMAGAFLVLLGLLPGLPLLPFGVLGVTMGASAWGLSQARARQRPGAHRSGGAPGTTPELAPLSVALGPRLAAALDVQRGPLEAPLRALEQDLFHRFGMRLPNVQLEQGAALGPDDYELRVLEVPQARGTAESGAAEAAQAIVAELDRLVRRHARELVGIQETRALLDQLERTHPAVVQHLVPKPVPVDLLTEVLRRLLEEGVSIRPLRQILEACAALGGSACDAGQLTEGVRVALGRQITFRHSRDGVLAVHPVDAMIEDVVRAGIRVGATGAPYLALGSRDAADVIDAVRAALGTDAAREAVVVSQPDVRPGLHALLRPELPQVTVLSYDELAPEARIERLAAIAPIPAG